MTHPPSPPPYGSPASPPDPSDPHGRPNPLDPTQPQPQPGQPTPPGQFGQPGQPTPPGVPAKKSKTALIIAIALVLLLCCGGAVVVGGVVAFQQYRDGAFEDSQPALPDLPAQTEPGSEPSYDESGSGTVVYEVTGQGPATIIHVDENGVPALPETNVSLPWRKVVTPRNAAVRLLFIVSATRTGQGDGDISCRITVGGVEKDSRRASGPNAKAECTGTSIG